MYRVVLPVVLSFSLGACSLGNSQPFSFGLGDSAPTQTARSGASVRSNTVGLGGDPSTTRSSSPNPKVAAAAHSDRAPKGSFDRAPAGALADRDYSTTNLDAARARDLINAYGKTNGLKPLSLNSELTTAAKAHA